MKTATSGIAVSKVLWCVAHGSFDNLLTNTICKPNTEYVPGKYWHATCDHYFRHYFPLTYVGRRLNRKKTPELSKSGQTNLAPHLPCDGTIIKLDTVDGYVRFRYTEGPRDRAHMQAQDYNYLHSLLESDDPSDRTLFEEEMASLDLTLKHHQELQAAFEKHTRAYQAGAAGGGEGGSESLPIDAVRSELEDVKTTLRAKSAVITELRAALRASKKEQERMSMLLATLEERIRRREERESRPTPGVTFIAPEDLTQGRLIGSGDMGKVYEGTCLGRPYALKVLNLEVFTPESMAVFQQEARKVCGVTHDRLTHYGGLSVSGGCYRLLMEQVSGATLEARLSDVASDGLGLDTQYRIARDIAQGLAKLHSHGIVHGRLKSSNVLLVGEAEDVKLTNYGFPRTYAKLFKFGSKVAWLDPQSMAPKAQPRTEHDIHAFGMVLWRMATREQPYASCSGAEEVRLAVLTQEKETVPESVPEALRVVIQDCWREPRARPTAESLVRTFSQLMRGDQFHEETPPGLHGGGSPGMAPS